MTREEHQLLPLGEALGENVEEGDEEEVVVVEEEEEEDDEEEEEIAVKKKKTRRNASGQMVPASLLLRWVHQTSGSEGFVR